MKKLIGGIVLFVLIIQFQITFAATSIPYKWNSLPMGAHGFVTGIAMHPNEQDLMYVRTDVGGAYRWDKSSESWIQLCDSFSFDQWGLYGIDGIAIDPQNTDVVYIATGEYTWAAGDVYKSTDRGTTWRKTGLNKSFDSNGGMRSFGECIAVDPVNSSIVYSGTALDGLWKSEDGASTWQKVAAITTKTDKTNQVRNIVFDKNSVSGGKCQTIYAGVTNVGIYKSTDGGGTWALISGTPTNAVRMEVGNSGTLYIASGKGLFKYSNDTFTEISDASQIGKSHRGISIDPTDENKLICVGYATDIMNQPIYYTTDGGSTWVEKVQTAQYTSILPWDKAREFTSNTADIKIDPFNPKKVWTCDFSGVYVTNDITSSPNQVWTNPIKGIEELVTRDAISPPTGKYRLITAIADVDGFPYEDITKFPTRQIRANKDAVYMMGSTQIDFCEEDPNIVLRVGVDYYSNGKAEYSVDNTESWYNITNIRNYVNSAGAKSYVVPYGRAAVSAQKNPTTGKPPFVIIPAYYLTNDKRLAAGQTTVPMVSLDLGATWQEVKGFPAGTNIIDDYWDKYNPIASDRVNGSKFYIWTKNYVYVSTDWGLNWTATAFIGGDANKTIIHAAPKMEGEVWVGNGDGIYRSQNSGSTFSKLPNVTNCIAFGFGKEAPGRENATVYLYGTIDGVIGMYRSIDMGSSWVRINDDANKLGNLPNSIVGDSRRFGLVYVGSGGRGFYTGQSMNSVSETRDYFNDNFYDGNRIGWSDVSGAWSVENDGTNAVSKQSNPTGDSLSYSGDDTWVDYSAEAKVKLISGSGGATLVGRYIDADNYYSLKLLPGTEGKVQLYKKVAGVTTLLQETTMTINTDTWYTLRLSMQISNLIGYVDGEKKVSATDSNIGNGCIAVGGFDQVFEVDDIKVDVPTLLMDNFEDGNSTDWTAVNGDWSVVNEESQVLKQSATNGESTIYLDNSLGRNYSIEAKVMTLSDNSGASIMGRYIDQSNYYFLKLVSGTNGKVQLYKKINGASTLLNEVAMNINSNTWYTLKLNLTGNKITGYVNDVEKVTASDVSLSFGRIGFSGFGQDFAVDDVNVNIAFYNIKGFSSDFNSYTEGLPLGGQNGWITDPNTANCYAKIVADPKDANNKCINIQHISSTSVPMNANRKFTTIDGEGSDGIAVVQFRFLLYNLSGYEGGLQIRSGGKVVADLTNKYTNNAQRIALLHPAIGSNAGNTTKVYHTLKSWTGNGDAAKWYTYKFVLNFKTSTLDAYVGEGTLPQTPTISNIPFVSAGITSIDNVNLYTFYQSSATQNYFDDFSISNEAEGTFDVATDSANYSVNGSTVDVNANITMPVVGAGTANVIAVAYDADNNIIGIDTSFYCRRSDLQNGVIPYNKTFTVSSPNVAKTKIFVWSTDIRPYCISVDCLLK